jgi:hypothetical protein
VCRKRWARVPRQELSPAMAGGLGSRAAQPARCRPLLSSCSQQPRQLTEIPTTSNFLQEPHTGGEKITQAFPMKSFPQALPTPRASWLGLGPPPSTSLLGVQHLPRLRAHSCLKPLTFPRNVFLPLHKAPLFFPCLNLKLLSVLCLPVWGGGDGGRVAREKWRRERKGDSRPSGSLFTLESPHTQPNSASRSLGKRLQWMESSHVLQGRRVLSETFHS